MINMRKKLIAVLLAVTVAMTWSFPVFAWTGNQPADSSADPENGAKAGASVEEPAEPETEPEKEPEVKQEPAPMPEAETKPAAESDNEAASEPDSASGTDKNVKNAPSAPANKNADPQDESGSKGTGTKGAAGGHSTYMEVNNSTSLSDGTYTPDSFTCSGAPEGVQLSCDSVTVSGGTAEAVIRVNSKGCTHFFTGTVEQDNRGDSVNTDLYNSETESKGTGVYETRTDSNGAYVTIPAAIGSEMNLSCRMTDSEEPYWITCAVKISVTESSSGDDVIKNGTYKPDKFEFTGGSGRVTFDCRKVIVKDGEATAVFTVNTDTVTHVYMDKVASRAENSRLYDPQTGKTGNKVYTIGKQQVSVPVVLNETKPFSGRTTAMSAKNRWINYTYKITLTSKSVKISDSTEIPKNPASAGGTGGQTNSSGKDSADEPKEPASAKDKQKLSAGTWKVKATTKRKMFYLYPKEQDPAWVVLKINKNKTMKATIILSGDGYDYVYMGTPKQARSAGKSKWIKAKIVNGYYTFEVPVSALDKKLAITPHSKKYELDNDPSTDPWRPDKWILFYSKGAVKTKAGTKIKTKAKKNGVIPDQKTQTKFANDNKADKESKWKDDSNKSTSAVDNSTSLKDGVYTPDQFRWSGGSGRLAYIRCNKITVKGGKAYATLEFASSKYDSLKANGRVYSKQGSGNSVFVIPVKLNANNTIIGRTTAMSQPHWIKYTIFIYKAGATGGKDGKKGAEGKLVDTNKLADEAPELIGLENKGKTEIKYAELFKIYQYEQGITLICIDQYSDTDLYVKPKKEDQQEASAAKQEEKIEYDEDGKPIAKSENVFTNELYQNNIVNYLVVPEDVELPAGLEKDCIIIRKPVESVFADCEAAENLISQIGKEGLLLDQKEFGTYDKPDFRKVVLNKTDLVVLPSEALPDKTTRKSDEKDIKASEEKTKVLQRLQMRYSSLAVPVMVDRSQQEKEDLADAEWIKVYGAVFGEDEAAGKLFDQYVKENSEKETTEDE